jgi:hypothetical protein
MAFEGGIARPIDLHDVGNRGCHGDLPHVILVGALDGFSVQHLRHAHLPAAGLQAHNIAPLQDIDGDKQLAFLQLAQLDQELDGQG